MAVKDWVARRKVDAQNYRTRRVLARENERARLSKEAVAARKELAALRKEERDRAELQRLRSERFKRSRTGRVLKGAAKFASKASAGMNADFMGGSAPRRRVRRKSTRKGGKRRKASRRRNAPRGNDIFGDMGF